MTNTKTPLVAVCSVGLIVIFVFTPFATSALNVSPITPLSSWSYRDENGLEINERASETVTTNNGINYIEIITPRKFPQFFKEIDQQAPTDSSVSSLSVLVDVTTIAGEMIVSQTGGLPISISNNFNLNIQFLIEYSNEDTFSENILIPINEHHDQSTVSANPDMTFQDGQRIELIWALEYQSNFTFSLIHKLEFENESEKDYRLVTKDYEMRYNFADPFDELNNTYVSEFVAYVSTNTLFWVLTIKNPHVTYFGSYSISNQRTIMELTYQKQNAMPRTMEYRDLDGNMQSFTLKSSIKGLFLGLGISTILLVVTGLIIYYYRKKWGRRTSQIEVSTHTFTEEDDFDIRPPKDRIDFVIQTRECCKLNGSNGRLYCNLCGRAIPVEWIA